MILTTLIPQREYRTHLRAHYRAYAVAVRAAKKRHFSASIASSQCRPAELFRVVQGLVHPGPKEELIPPSKARCDDFAEHFREKIAQIRHELDSTIDSEVLRETPTLPSGPELLDEFQLLRPDDVDKVLGRVRPTTCLLDPCPSWLIKDSKHGIGTWILEVVNASLREGRVPAPLKEAVVRPVLKKASLDPGMAANYRPVANIPFLGKVLERVVAGQLQALLDETDYLDPFQSGFRPGYGTESALVALYDDLCREKDRGSASLLVLLDLSAAFDTIDHGILLDRLAGLGVGGTALRWFRSYLNDRFQKVVLGDYGSAPWQLCHGVPQGSILSPLLFNIYMKPLGEVIRRCGLRTHQYADDTQLYLSFSTNPGEAVAVLNRCLAEVMGWMRANKLKLNPDKTEVLLVGGSGFGEGDLNLVLNGVALPPRDKVRSLGVLLDPELSLEAQVTTAARSAFLQLRLIHQLRPYLEYDCLATVTHALVTSRLDFCSALYVGLPLKTVRILQLVQNRAARLLTGTGRYVHMTPVLRQLHWLPIEVRAQFKVLVMTYKALNGLGPGYLKERLHPYLPREAVEIQVQIDGGFNLHDNPVRQPRVASFVCEREDSLHFKSFDGKEEKCRFWRNGAYELLTVAEEIPNSKLIRAMITLSVIEMEANNHFNFTGLPSSPTASGLKSAPSSGDNIYTNGSPMNFPQQGKSKCGAVVLDHCDI
ncbi:RNA-directed DNA polymerase from mobile element jockey [Varanus komodoensis]|nr:RNA-directed DNA polymerase from mobile element jockey [Varanus komodoensis]